MAIKEIFGMGNLVPGYLGNSFKVKAVRTGVIQEVDSEAEVEAFATAQESDVRLYSLLPQYEYYDELVVEDLVAEWPPLFTYVPPVGEDDDFQALETAFDDAGLTMTANESYAYERLILRLKNHGLWNTRDHIYIAKGIDSLDKALFNIKNPALKLVQNDAANPATHSTANGFVFTGVGKCALKVPQVNANFSLTDCAFHVGITSITGSSKQYAFGWFNDSDNYTALSKNASSRWQYGLNSDYKYVSNNSGNFLGNYNFSCHPIEGRFYTKDGDTLEKDKSFLNTHLLAGSNIDGPIYLGALNRAKGAEYFSNITVSHYISGANTNHEMEIIDEIMDAFYHEVSTGTAHTFSTKSGLVDIFEISGLAISADGFVRGDLDAAGYTSAEKETIRKHNVRQLAKKCYINSTDAIPMTGRLEVWADEQDHYVRVPENAKWYLKGTNKLSDVIAIFPRVNIPETGDRTLFSSLLNNDVKIEKLGIGSDVKPWKMETYLCNVDGVDRTKVTLTNTRVDELYVREDIRFTAGTIRPSFLTEISVGDVLHVVPETLRKSNYSDGRAAILTVAEVNAGSGYIRFETEIPVAFDEVYIAKHFDKDVTVADVNAYGQNWLIGGDSGVDEDTGEKLPGVSLAIYSDKVNQSIGDPANRRFIDCDFRNANTGYHKSGGSIKVYLDGGTWHGCGVAYSVHNGDYGFDTRVITSNGFECYDNGFRIIGCYNSSWQDANTDFEDKSNFSKNRLGSGGYTHPNTICEFTGTSDDLIEWYDNPTGAHRQYSGTGNKEVIPGGVSFYKYCKWDGNQEYNSFGSQGMPTTYENCTWKNGNCIYGFKSTFKDCTFDGAYVANKAYAQPRPVLDADGNILTHDIVFEDCTFDKCGVGQTWVREGDYLNITFRRCHFQLGEIDPPYEMWDWVYTSGQYGDIFKSHATTLSVTFEECTFDYDAGSLAGKKVNLVNSNGGRLATVTFRDCTALTDFSTGVSGAASYKLVTQTSGTYGTTNVIFEGENDLQTDID